MASLPPWPGGDTEHGLFPRKPWGPAVQQRSHCHCTTALQSAPREASSLSQAWQGSGWGGRGLLCRLMTHRFLGIPSTCEEGAKSQHSDGKGSFAQSLVARVGGVSCGVGGVWRLCMRGETLRQKRGHGWPCGAASRKKACGQNFHRLLRHTGCACFPKVFFPPTFMPPEAVRLWLRSV